MKGKRTDLELKATVIEWLVNGKLGSDISKETGVHESTISRIKDNNLQEVASESKKIASLIDRNNNLQSMADARIESMLKSWETVIRLSELTGLRESTFKQNQLLTDSSTENTKLVIEWANED